MARAPDATIDDGVPSLLVEVGDSGVGIAAEHHDLIFREFAQVDSTPSRPHHGTGLGLTIARKLVELHGGRIWVESQLGTGQPFLLHRSARQSGLTGPRREIGQAHVLVVEDNELVSSAMRILFEAVDHRLSVAASVAETLDFARHDPPRSRTSSI